MDQGLGKEGPLLHPPGKGLAEVFSLVCETGQAETLADLFLSPHGIKSVGMGEEVAEFLHPQVVIDGGEVGHVAEHPAGLFGFVQN